MIDITLDPIKVLKILFFMGWVFWTVFYPVFKRNKLKRDSEIEKHVTRQVQEMLRRDEKLKREVLDQLKASGQ
jgi:hypothetical protein